MTLRKASEVVRGDRVSKDGFWLEVVRVNPTNHPDGLLQFLFLNGRAILYRPDEEVLTER